MLQEGTASELQSAQTWWQFGANGGYGSSSDDGEWELSGYLRTNKGSSSGKSDSPNGTGATYDDQWDSVLTSTGTNQLQESTSYGWSSSNTTPNPDPYGTGTVTTNDGWSTSTPMEVQYQVSATEVLPLALGPQSGADMAVPSYFHNFGSSGGGISASPPAGTNHASQYATGASIQGIIAQHTNIPVSLWAPTHGAPSLPPSMFGSPVIDTVSNGERVGMQMGDRVNRHGHFVSMSLVQAEMSRTDHDSAGWDKWFEANSEGGFTDSIHHIRPGAPLPSFVDGLYQPGANDSPFIDMANKREGNFLDGVLKLEGLRKSFQNGIVQGFFQDGLLDSAKSYFVDLPKTGYWWVTDGFWRHGPRIALGMYAFNNPGAVPPSMNPAVQVGNGAKQLLQEFLSLDNATRQKLLNGETDGLSGKVSKELLMMFEIGGGLFRELIKKVQDAQGATDDEKATMLGRVFGFVMYEIAKGVALNAAAAQLKTIKVAGLLQKLKALKWKNGTPFLSDELTEVITKWGMRVLNSTCFVAGTPLLTPSGSKPIEEFQPGDAILSKSEHDPEGPVVERRVERVFQLTGLIAELRVGGRLIETTAEHPFYVPGQGWKKTCELEPGDHLVGHDGTLTPVEEITLTERTSAVYNLRVAEDHTYFVGDKSWGFSIWAHNIYRAQRASDGTWEVYDDIKKTVRKLDDDGQPFTQATAEEFAKRWRAPKSLGEINLKGTIQGYGMTLAEEGKFFGWNPSSVSKSASDFTKEQLLARGWTKERLLEVAEKYEWINNLTHGHGNPSAAGRAAQLREIVEKLF